MERFVSLLYVCTTFRINRVEHSHYVTLCSNEMKEQQISTLIWTHLFISVFLSFTGQADNHLWYMTEVHGIQNILRTQEYFLFLQHWHCHIAPWRVSS